jgi:hypothetical protein
VLRTAFIGNENIFDRRICEWLSERTDLSLIIWTNDLSWAGGRGLERKRRVLRRFARRLRTKGLVRTLDEALYYLVYRRFIARGETRRLKQLVADLSCAPARPLSAIDQLRPRDIASPALTAALRERRVDALFAMCIDTYLPKALTSAPRHGCFLWHEGITPEYRGVYSPFWALANRDYERIGYTMLKMNSRLDAGDIFVQGPARDIDVHRDWHSYIGHKAIVDSLPAVGRFLVELERETAVPLPRPGAIDGYYSYPTATALLKILRNRVLRVPV